MHGSHSNDSVLETLSAWLSRTVVTRVSAECARSKLHGYGLVTESDPEGTNVEILHSLVCRFFVSDWRAIHVMECLHQLDYSSDAACLSFPEREERRSISIHVLTVVVGASWCLRCVPNIRRRSCTRARAGLGFGSDMTRAAGALEKLKLIRGYAGSRRVESRNRRDT